MRDTNSRSRPRIDQGEALNGRGLAQQAKASSLPLAGFFRPRQLHGPAELLADTVDEILDLHRRQPGFGVQDVVQPGALVAIAQPGFAAARDQQRRHDRRENVAKYFQNSDVRAAPRHWMASSRAGRSTVIR